MRNSSSTLCHRSSKTRILELIIHIFLNALIWQPGLVVAKTTHITTESQEVSGQSMKQHKKVIKSASKYKAKTTESKKSNTNPNHLGHAKAKASVKQGEKTAQVNSVYRGTFAPGVYQDQSYNTPQPEFFHKPSDLKIGLVQVSTFTDKSTIDQWIESALNRNILDGYLDPNKDFVGCYAFITPFSKSNFLHFSSISYAAQNKSFALDPIKQYDLMAQDLNTAFHNNQTNILLAARGGYGIAKMMNQLYALNKPVEPKIFIGFSDNTLLHIFLSQEWGWKSIHGPSLVSTTEEHINNRGVSQSNIRKLMHILMSKKPSHIYIDLEPINTAGENFAKQLKHQGSTNDIDQNDSPGAKYKNTALITGGNLFMIQTSIGCKWQINPRGKILILEEVNEPYYKVERALIHLKQSGIFDGVAAVILGDMGNKISPMQLKTLGVLIELPTFSTNKVGHGKYNYPVIFNHPGSILWKDGGLFMHQKYLLGE